MKGPRLIGMPPLPKREAALPKLREAEFFLAELKQRDPVDFRKWLDGPVFEPLRDASYFQRFFLEAGTVVWPNGADIAPETLYEASGVRTRSINRMQRTSSAARKRSAARR